MDCVHKPCNSTEATQHNTEKEGKTYITQLCDACFAYLIGKDVQFLFYRCGGLIFIESIKEVDKPE